MFFEFCVGVLVLSWERFVDFRNCVVDFWVELFLYLGGLFLREFWFLLCIGFGRMYCFWWLELVFRCLFWCGLKYWFWCVGEFWFCFWWCWKWRCGLFWFYCWWCCCYWWLDCFLIWCCWWFCCLCGRCFWSLVCYECDCLCLESCWDCCWEFCCFWRLLVCFLD